MYYEYLYHAEHENLRVHQPQATRRDNLSLLLFSFGILFVYQAVENSFLLQILQIFREKHRRYFSLESMYETASCSTSLCLVLSLVDKDKLFFSFSGKENSDPGSAITKELPTEKSPNKRVRPTKINK